jgi:hypothetical protein
MLLSQQYGINAHGFVLGVTWVPLADILNQSKVTAEHKCSERNDLTM